MNPKIYSNVLFIPTHYGYNIHVVFFVLFYKENAVIVIYKENIFLKSFVISNRKFWGKIGFIYIYNKIVITNR